MTTYLFNNICIIGGGLIGSSIARAARQYNLAQHITIADQTFALPAITACNIADTVTDNLGQAVANAHLVIICTPQSSYDSVGKAIGPHLMADAIVSDTGSVKQAAIEALSPYLPNNVYFVAGHPIAGTENSGPAAGFAHLFKDRWQLLCPDVVQKDNAEYQQALQKLIQFWQACGSKVDCMNAQHHDRVLAMTSHLPHLIAYSIVDTVATMEQHMQAEVIKYSAGGFRDFTRIAASNPIMWRDVFLNNKDAVLDGLQRFIEDLTALQRAIRFSEGDKLEEVFTRTRAIRRGVIEHKQEVPEAYKNSELP